MSFKAGDRVVCTVDHSDQFTAGREYTVLHHIGGAVGVATDDKGRPNGWNEQYFRPVASSPIRTVTRREIVPSYIDLPCGVEMHVEPAGSNGAEIHLEHGRLDAASLREAARIFNEIAEVLEDL